jgi:hypothetical protein
MARTRSHFFGGGSRRTKRRVRMVRIAIIAVVVVVTLALIIGTLPPL